uniref:EFR3 homolog B n=1 Tax=Cyprinodon variegatus TaxID=28743 RepID=A0A3Q2FYL8_CYPVA
MEKLTFFALSAPEKLDRIAAYLSERLTRELNRHRYGYVCIALEAMEQLLLACHCQSINLLVESFLSTLRLLLEADRPHLHILATNSFVKFANIEEDTPSYHRSYDFFVSRFSEMCHSDHEDPDMKIKSVILLMRQNFERHLNSLSVQLHSSFLCCCCVFRHLDRHSLWEGRGFAVRCFQIIMFSIQSQHSHLVIQQLLGHLDANSRSPASVRAGIVEVLSEAAAIEVTGSVGQRGNLMKTSPPCASGPTVLEVFNTLLRQLRQSVDYQLTGYYDNAGKHKTTSVHEKTLQDAVIRTIGSFANTLPVYQRSEVMLFIMGRIPVPGIYPALGSPNAGFEGSRMIQVMLLKSLLQSSNLLTALPSSFLEPLLSFTLMEDPEIRLLVLSILTSLIDRHQNAARIPTVRFYVQRSLLCGFLPVQHAQRLYRHIYLACKEENNGSNHYKALFSLMAVLSVELLNEEVLVDLIRLTLALQELGTSNQESLSFYNRCSLHAVCAAFFHLLSQLGPPPPLHQHVAQVIESRWKEAPHLLPENLWCDQPRYRNKLLPKGDLKVDKASLFVQSKICEALTGSSYSAQCERINTPYTPQLMDEDRLSRKISIADTISLQIAIDHESSSEAQKPQTEQITFETLKNTIDDRGLVEEEDRRRRMQVVERFQTAPFEEIAALCGSRTSLLQSKLDQVFDLIVRPPPSPSGQTSRRSTPIYEMKFPDLCVY